MNAFGSVGQLALTRKQAAALCGLSTAGFADWVRRGIVPGLIPGTRRWSTTALVEKLEGGPRTARQSEFEEWKRENEGRSKRN